MHPKISAVVLSCHRSSNVPIVVASLRLQSCISDVYVWHNSPSVKKIPFAVNVVSESNFGCRVRHYFGASLNADYIVFIDDDLTLLEDHSAVILEAIKAHGRDGVLGIFGVNLSDAHLEFPYSNGSAQALVSDMTQIDIVKGRFHVIERNLLRKSLSWSSLGGFSEQEDDIFLNLSVQMVTNKPSYLFPVSRIGQLPEIEALSMRKHHYADRDSLVKEFLARGWQSKRDKTRIGNESFEAYNFQTPFNLEVEG